MKENENFYKNGMEKGTKGSIYWMFPLNIDAALVNRANNCG